MNVDKLRELGSEWMKGSYHRIYFNGLAQRLGLECTYYKTGNVSDATLNGDYISNTGAHKLIWQCRNTKIWYDVVAGQFASRSDAGGLDQDDIDAIIASIRSDAN